MRIYAAGSTLRITIAAALLSGNAIAYSQFTHEELIDVLWDSSIRPLLLQRYPGTTEAQLYRAHSYAYGGCLIQDIGYYPFGKRLFSDLTHYVRTGDFVLTLLRNSRNVDEFAFALGALSHYVGDSIGHSEAVNRATPLIFPDLRARYGAEVTYEQAPTAHVRTEFGFDVAQTAWERYAPGAYRKKIGLRVARPLLYRTFHEIYGLHTTGVLGPARAASRSYRWSVTKLIPLFVNAEVVILQDRLPQELGTSSRQAFSREVAAAEHAAHWVDTHSGPGVGAHAAALLIRVIPKIGALKILAVEPPTTETEDLFVTSVVQATSRFRELIEALSGQPDLSLKLEDLDLDTGRSTAPGESRVVDQTFAKLLSQLVREKTPPPPATAQRVLDFFANAQTRLLLTPRELKEVQTDRLALAGRYAGPLTRLDVEHR